VFDANGQLIKQASQLKTGDQVRTLLGEGEFAAKVGQVKDKTRMICALAHLPLH
jgi:ribosomal 50S subunit-recycling heat shock protein